MVKDLELRIRRYDQKGETMARIAGVNVPDNKRALISLTYVHGIGRHSARQVLKTVGIDEARRMNDLSEDELNAIRAEIDTDKYTIEGDLRRQIAQNIKRLMDMACYRGL